MCWGYARKTPSLRLIDSWCYKPELKLQYKVFTVPAPEPPSARSRKTRLASEWLQHVAMSMQNPSKHQEWNFFSFWKSWESQKEKRNNSNTRNISTYSRDAIWPIRHKPKFPASSWQWLRFIIELRTVKLKQIKELLCTMKWQIHSIVIQFYNYPCTAKILVTVHWWQRAWFITSSHDSVKSHGKATKCAQCCIIRGFYEIPRKTM